MGLIENGMRPGIWAILVIFGFFELQISRGALLCMYDCCQLGPDCDDQASLTPDGYCTTDDDYCVVPQPDYGSLCCYGAQAYYLTEQLSLSDEDCVGYLSGALYNSSTPKAPTNECSFYSLTQNGFVYAERAFGKGSWIDRHHSICVFVMMKVFLIVRATSTYIEWDQLSVSC